MTDEQTPPPAPPDDPVAAPTFDVIRTGYVFRSVADGDDTRTGYFFDSVPPVAATGATMGAPGAFTPVGSQAPLAFANMAGIVATPGTAWTTGKYVDLRDNSKAYWNGTAWVAGVAP